MSRVYVIPVDGRYVEWYVPDVRMEWLQEMLGGFVETVKLPDDPGVLWIREMDGRLHPINWTASALIQRACEFPALVPGSAILTGMESAAGFTDAPDLPALMVREQRLRDEAWARYRSAARVSEGHR